MTVLRAAVRDGRRSTLCSSSRQALPPSAAGLLRRKNLRVLRALRATRLVSPASSSTMRNMVLQRQERAAVANAGNLMMLARLALERLPTEPLSAPQSSPTASSQTASPSGQAILYAPAVASKPVLVEPFESGVLDVPPESYLLRLLEKRGRQPKQLLSTTEAGYHRPPTEKQIEDYTSKPFVTDLVRKADIEGLEKAVRAGRGMDATNKFGESVVHVACRTGNIDVLRFLVANGGSLTCCDDLGRFPLHEVCWLVEPRFDIVRLFLDANKRGSGRGRDRGDAAVGEGAKAGGVEDGDNDSFRDDAGVNLLLVTDKRGCTPLRYVKRASWPQWRAFFDEIVDEYWPSL